MNKFIFLIIFALLTACSNGSSSNSTNPVGPGVNDSIPDYSAIEITYLEIFYDPDRTWAKYYMLSTIENKSGQTFTNLKYDGTNEFRYTDAIFDLGPYEVLNIDSSEHQGSGLMPAGNYDTIFYITPFGDFDNRIAFAYDDITIE